MLPLNNAKMEKPVSKFQTKKELRRRTFVFQKPQDVLLEKEKKSKLDMLNIRLLLLNV